MPSRAKAPPEARVLEHRLDPDGCYRMVVHVDVSKVLEDGSPDPAFLRSFEWGPLPIVPDQMVALTAQESYAGIHQGRPKARRVLVAGEPFVDEKEYVYLQLCEAMETVAAEREAAEARPKKLKTEGVSF